MYNYTYSTGEIFIYNNCVMNASELLECELWKMTAWNLSTNHSLSLTHTLYCVNYHERVNCFILTMKYKEYPRREI